MARAIGKGVASILGPELMTSSLRESSLWELPVYASFGKAITIIIIILTTRTYYNAIT